MTAPQPIPIADSSPSRGRRASLGGFTLPAMVPASPTSGSSISTYGPTTPSAFLTSAFLSGSPPAAKSAVAATAPSSFFSTSPRGSMAAGMPDWATRWAASSSTNPPAPTSNSSVFEDDESEDLDFAGPKSVGGGGSGGGGGGGDTTTTVGSAATAGSAPAPPVPLHHRAKSGSLALQAGWAGAVSVSADGNVKVVPTAVGSGPRVLAAQSKGLPLAESHQRGSQLMRRLSLGATGLLSKPNVSPPSSSIASPVQTPISASMPAPSAFVDLEPSVSAGVPVEIKGRGRKASVGGGRGNKRGISPTGHRILSGTHGGLF